MDEWKPDITIIDRWECPKENGPAILTMPNVPFPLHGEGCQPRTIFGSRVWNFMRNYCYKQAEDTCEVCGFCPEDKRKRHAHELFSYDYTTQTAKFERCICLCYTCHVLGIHTGRALTMYQKGSPIFSKEALLAGAENAFKIIYDYNKAHPDDEPLRLYSTWVDYWKEPSLKQDMETLIKKYDLSLIHI